MYPLNARLNCWSTTQFSIAISRIQFVRLYDFCFCLILFMLVLFCRKQRFFLLSFYLILIRFVVSETQHITLHIFGSWFLLSLSPTLTVSHALSLSPTFSLTTLVLRLYSSFDWLLFRFGFYCSGCFHLSLLWTHKYFKLLYSRMLCMDIYYVCAESRLRTVIFKWVVFAAWAIGNFISFIRLVCALVHVFFLVDLVAVIVCAYKIHISIYD